MEENSGIAGFLVIVIIGLIIWLGSYGARIVELEGQVMELGQQVSDLEDQNEQLQNERDVLNDQVECTQSAMPFSGADYYELWDAINEIESCVL